MLGIDIKNPNSNYNRKIRKRYHPDLKKNCLIEYNFYDNDGSVVRDSSGFENNGVLIGDFGLFKLDKDIPIGVDSTIKKPKIDESNDGVF